MEAFPPLSPPPPYSATLSSSNDLKSSSSFMEKRRRQRAESKSALDGFMVDKMNNLEQMVARMQDALSRQSFAINDVHDQLTDINHELGKVYDAKDTTTKFAIRAQVRPVDGAAASRPRSRRGGPRHTPSHRSSISSLGETTEEMFYTPPTQHAILEEPVRVDPFEIVEEEEGDEDYARVCSMLQGLLSEAHGAIATKHEVEEEFADALDDEAHAAQALTLIMPHQHVMEDPSESEEAKRLNQALAALEQDHAESTLDTITHKSVDAGEAVEVRFYCQIIQGGKEPIRHELRRKLVVPLMTANNTNFLRKLLVGSVDEGEVSGISGALIRHTPNNLAMLAARAVGTVQLMYWMLLMTIGALMMDVYLCELAGKQVVKVVQVLSPNALEEASDQVRQSKVKQIEPKQEEAEEEEEELGPRRRRRHRRVSF